MTTLHSSSRCLKDAVRLPTLYATLHAPPPPWLRPARLPVPSQRQQQVCAASTIAAPSAESTGTSVIQRLTADIRSGNRSAAEVTAEYLQELGEREPELQSFITIDADGARAQAAAIDRQRSSEGASSLGPLAGVPIAVKDNLCTRGVQTTAGSRVLRGHVPAYDATAVARLRAAGAVLVGKTNMDSFGMGSSTENSDFQVTRNPWDLDRVPGGSSGGSASAVAAGQAAAALGSDTGGSVRQPAHFCGVVGLKPTYGRVSRYGLIAYASSLDVVGPIASSVMDAAVLLTAIAGVDTADATSARAAPQDFAAQLLPTAALDSSPLLGRRVGLLKQLTGSGIDPAVNDAFQAACRHLESLGAVVEEVSLPTLDIGLAAYYVIAMSEASSNLSRYDGVRYGLREQADSLLGMYARTRGAGLGDEVKRRILTGTYALSAGFYDAYYMRAQQVRTLVQREMSAALERHDVLVSPVAPTAAYRIGERSSDPLAMYKGDLMTVPINLAGLPAVSIPCGFDSTTGSRRLPIGLQLIGRPFEEADLLQIAHVFEQTSYTSTAP